MLNEVLIKEIKSIPERLNQLTDKERFDIVIKLLPYIIPKPKEIEMNINDHINIPIIHWVGNTADHH